jgi:acyl-CoA dehydrogenase
MEHKMGLHGSPTCTLTYGDKGGAVGYLIGQENRGLQCMFTMMNNARLVVGIQGVGVGDAAFQRARAYAADRRQGRPAGMDQSEAVAIIEHPDIRRELMMIRAQTTAARALCHLTAAALDRAHANSEDNDDEDTRSKAQGRADLLTPLAKAYSTDTGVDGASRGIQVHGGMGFIEETGAAQLLRDVRVAAIYEGTNGIQAIDLVTRKLPQDGGRVVAALVDDLNAINAKTSASDMRIIRDMASPAQQRWVILRQPLLISTGCPMQTPTAFWLARPHSCGLPRLPLVAFIWQGRGQR